MADQRSRGGQKQASERQAQGKKQRGVGTNTDKGQHPRDMGSDARRGRQGQQGGTRQRNANDEEE